MAWENRGACWIYRSTCRVVSIVRISTCDDCPYSLRNCHCADAAASHHDFRLGVLFRDAPVSNGRVERIGGPESSGAARRPSAACLAGICRGGVFVVRCRIPFLAKALHEASGCQAPCIDLDDYVERSCALRLAIPRWNAAEHGSLVFTAVSISSFWYLAYAATDQKGSDPTPLVARAGWMRPFWGGSATPMGKSFGYLNKFDAKNDEELAATRLKAIKLVVWAIILIGICSALKWAVHDTLQVPTLQTAILSHANGSNAGLAMNWFSLVSNYFIDLLVIAIWGHLLVAIIRMVGYRIPRNTRNPLASRTLAEFWNRYFFYYKELLVDFFFYPAFVRYFKSSPRIRIAFATFCAAGLGNFLYHFYRDIYLFAKFEPLEALSMFASLAFYCVALAVGLMVSQWRGVRLAPEDGFWRYEVLPRLNVFFFFCFLKIFDTISTQLTLPERAQFTLSLFYP